LFRKRSGQRDTMALNHSFHENGPTPKPRHTNKSGASHFSTAFSVSPLQVEKNSNKPVSDGIPENMYSEDIDWEFLAYNLQNVPHAISACLYQGIVSLKEFNLLNRIENTSNQAIHLCNMIMRLPPEKIYRFFAIIKPQNPDLFRHILLVLKK